MERRRRDRASELAYAEEKGLEKGRAEAMEKIAINFLKEGVPVSLVVKATGLGEENVQKLLENLS
jgi:predicted transposase/invertase (TIGR01784 family)